MDEHVLVLVGRQAMSVFIIAEVGSTHGGNLPNARAAVEIFAQRGADAVKFQWTSDPARMAARRHASEYADAYRALAFPREWLAELAAHCQRYNVEFICTTFLPEDTAVVAPYVNWFKVSAFEATDDAFLALHEPFGKPVIVSTGMMDLTDVSLLVATHRHVTTVLHCVSAYPSPPEAMNLLAIDTMRAVLGPRGIVVGLSDHSRHVLTGALAVALGAEVVEVHVRLGSTLESCPDYPVSLSPQELKQYVENVRLAERMRGDGRKVMQDAERPLARYRVTT